MSNDKPLTTWLKDAYAMESQQISTLENHAKSVRDVFPDLHMRLMQHLETTKRHAEAVESCLKRHGESAPAVKTAVGKIMGNIAGVASSVAQDEVIKNCLGDYASEHFEIASYKSLITAAERMGDPETARVCSSILRDEEEMAHFLENSIPRVTENYVAQHGEH